MRILVSDVIIVTMNHVTNICFYDSNPDDSLEVIEGKEIIDREGVEEMRNGNWTVAYLKLFKRELLENLPFP